MESVDCLELIVKEAGEWTRLVDKCLKDSNFPYVSDLTDLLDEARKLPVSLSHIDLIEIKIDSANEWIARLNRLFISSKASKSELSTDSNMLIQVSKMNY